MLGSRGRSTVGTLDDTRPAPPQMTTAGGLEPTPIPWRDHLLAIGAPAVE